MNLLQKKLAIPTSVKYFFSYLIIITVLIIGFFFIIRSQFTKNYFSQRNEQAQEQLESIAEQLNDDILYLSQVDSALMSDMELMDGRHKTEGAYKYQALQELREYASTTKIISSIVYLPTKTSVPFSTQLPVSYKDGFFHITDASMQTVVFDPSPYFNASSGQLVFISDESVQHLIYFPPMNERANYIFFYILDIGDLQQQFKGYVSEEILSIALIDENKRFVASANPTQLMPYMDSVQFERGIYQVDSSTSLCVHTGISNGFSMVSILSHDYITSQINSAFVSCYMALMLLSVIGFLMIILAMRFTYLPLQRLTAKIVSNPDPKHGYLNQLESAFLNINNQNQLLMNKLENYRLSIQKSLLNTVVTSGQADEMAFFPDIDQFFDENSEKKIFIIQMTSPEGSLPWESIQRYLSEVLPGMDACIMLESKLHSAIFLINYTGTEQNKEEVLKNLCYKFYEEQGYLSAISNGSDSPMDIPSLYENVIHASSCWPTTPVVEFKSPLPASSAYSYPYDRLNRLSELLTENNFSDARQVIHELFQITNLYIAEKGNLPNFFIQCILIDILTIISNHMNLSYIRFHDYSDLYFETLYFCRSCPYKEKAPQIEVNIGKLMDFYELEISEKLITSAPLIQLIEEYYCQPDFSISVLADKFHVGISHMSHVFKREVGTNFSDYLWMLRLKKAKELLCTTDLSINDVSIAVGYFNTSSFRRKFKQETGITPSQFRTEFSKTQN